MISKETIKRLYKQFPNPPQELSDLNFNRLTTDLQHLSVHIGESTMTIGALTAENPFYEIPLRNVTGLEYVEDSVAIVLRHSILFLNLKNNNINVHINPIRENVLKKIGRAFKGIVSKE